MDNNIDLYWGLSSTWIPAQCVMRYCDSVLRSGSGSFVPFSWDGYRGIINIYDN